MDPVQDYSLMMCSIWQMEDIILMISHRKQMKSSISQMLKMEMCLDFILPGIITLMII